METTLVPEWIRCSSRLFKSIDEDVTFPDIDFILLSPERELSVGVIKTDDTVKNDDDFISMLQHIPSPLLAMPFQVT